LFLTTPVAEVAIALGAGDWPEDEPPRRNMAPGQDVLVFDGNVLKRMRWGMIPVGRVNARGRPVMETIINARSETVFDKSAFKGVGRAVVPADGWYEWTGKARRKQPWRLRAADEGLLFFAAITDHWDAPDGRRIAQVATVTCEPSEDVRSVHDRMGVLLPLASVSTWLSGPEAEARALAVPFSDGSLIVEPAGDVDWTAP
jgi:putative SOS response-associated peptidase YedK